ncbi:MAG: HDOD domain-containing protein [candidate division Zixibacteria bacterium]
MSPITLENEKAIKLIVAKIHNLPTPPIVFSQITKVVNNPNTSAYEIASIISEDPALTAKVLKLTNSSFYGISGSITNVKQAIVILGLEAIKSLVISASVFETFSKTTKLDTDYLEHFWRHSLSVASMAKIICRVKKIGSIQMNEQAFSAGLLHDIGKLIIISHLPQEHLKISDLLKDDSKRPEDEAEREILGFSHADIGSYLATTWNLPDSISLAIQKHHDFDSITAGRETAIIHLADYLAHKLENLEASTHNNEGQFYVVAWQTLETEPDLEPQLLEMLQEEYSKAETFMKMAQGVA